MADQFSTFGVAFEVRFENEEAAQKISDFLSRADTQIQEMFGRTEAAATASVRSTERNQGILRSALNATGNAVQWSLRQGMQAVNTFGESVGSSLLATNSLQGAWQGILVEIIESFKTVDSTIGYMLKEGGFALLNSGMEDLGDRLIGTALATGRSLQQVGRAFADFTIMAVEGTGRTLDDLATQALKVSAITGLGVEKIAQESRAMIYNLGLDTQAMEVHFSRAIAAGQVFGISTGQAVQGLSDAARQSAALPPGPQRDMFMRTAPVAAAAAEGMMVPRLYDMLERASRDITAVAELGVVLESAGRYDSFLRARDQGDMQAMTQLVVEAIGRIGPAALRDYRDVPDTVFQEVFRFSKEEFGRIAINFNDVVAKFSDYQEAAAMKLDDFFSKLLGGVESLTRLLEGLRTTFFGTIGTAFATEFQSDGVGGLKTLLSGVQAGIHERVTASLAATKDENVMVRIGSAFKAAIDPWWGSLAMWATGIWTTIKTDLSNLLSELFVPFLDAINSLVGVVGDIAGSFGAVKDWLAGGDSTGVGAATQPAAQSRRVAVGGSTTASESPAERTERELAEAAALERTPFGSLTREELLALSAALTANTQATIANTRAAGNGQPQQPVSRPVHFGISRISATRSGR